MVFIQITGGNMKTLGYFLVLGAIMTGIDGIGIFMASSKFLGIGGAALAFPAILLVAGIWLIRRSSPDK